MPKEGENTLVEQLLTNLLFKVDTQHEALNRKIETKVDKLQDNLTEELKNLKKELVERIVDLEDQADESNRRNP